MELKINIKEYQFNVKQGDILSPPSLSVESSIILLLLILSYLSWSLQRFIFEITLHGCASVNLKLRLSYVMISHGQTSMEN